MSSNNNNEEDTQEVNKIFSNNTIEQIATICGQMQQNVKQTRLELRNMIGNRHRELIDSCGELVGIDNVCRELIDMCEEKQHQHQQFRHNKHQQQQKKRSSVERTGSEETNKAHHHNHNKNENNNNNQKWIDEQMLRAMRASSLLREHELLDAAVQISILERDVSLGIQSIISSQQQENNNKEEEQQMKLPPQFHALQATVKPLRDQWNTAASKKLAKMTTTSTNTEDHHHSLSILASCFQGWGLLSRGTPKESLEHLLISTTATSASSSLCKNTIDRIKSTSSSTTEAVTRIARLLKMISDFLIDLFKRGPAALLSTNTNNIQTESPSSSSNKKKSNSAGFIPPTLENTSEEAASNFLTSLSHQVCALGVLDAEKSFTGTNKNNNQSSPSSTRVLQGWASPVMSPSPNNNNSSSSPQQNKNNSDLFNLPTIQEGLEIFEKSCKILFTPVLTSLIEKATDPSIGEASCFKILLPATSSSTTTSSDFSSKIQSCLKTQVCDVISTAAGSCILQHLSDSANQLIELAKPSTLLENNSNNNSQQQQQQPPLLFQTIRSFIFQQQQPLQQQYNSVSAISSSSATNKGRLLLSSLMNRKSSSNNISSSNTKKQNNTNPMRGRSASPAAASPSSTSSMLLMNNLTKINHHLNETIKHTRSALHRSISMKMMHNIDSVTRIILDLAKNLEVETRRYFKNATTTSSNNNNENQQQQQQQVGIAAAESLRYILEPLMNLFKNNNNNNQNQNIQQVSQILSNLQSELLSSWKSSVIESFDQEAANISQNEENNSSSSFLLSGSELLCKVEQSGDSNLSYPNRPSPFVLSALVHVVRQTTSLFPVPVPSTSNNEGVSSSSSSNSTFCPQHVRLELCAELCLQVLKKGIEKVSSGNQNQTSNINKKNSDLQLLQLYFDVCFTVLVLKGSSSSPQNISVELFSRVDSLRKDFVKQIETSVDVVTWSVTKSSINSAIKNAVDDSYFVTSILSSNQAKTQTASTNTIVKTNALKMSIENPCDRLPLLPLVALTPSSSSQQNSNMNSQQQFSSSISVGADGSISSGATSSSLFGFNNTSAASGEGENTAVEKLMAQGNAFTSRLKSVFQW